MILTPLEQALEQLKTSLSFCDSDLAKKDRILFCQFRSAAIQAFEYTYELSIKFLRRHLESEESSNEAVDILGYRDLIRLACEKGLIDDPELWFQFREKRNITSHTYAENRADEVYKLLPSFLEKAKGLLSRIR